MSDHYPPPTIEELRRIHRFHCAVYEEPIAEIPDGWTVVTRRWGWRSWDALIQSPRGPGYGWQLGGKMVPSRRRAIKRAAEEIRNHLAR